MGHNRAERVLETGNTARGYIDTPLGRKLASLGFSLRSFARLASVSHVDVWRYCKGEGHRVGAGARQRIWRALGAAGLRRSSKRGVKITVGYSGCAK